MSPSVQYSEVSFKKAGFVGGGKFLLLETAQDAAAALAHLDRAVRISNDLMGAREAEELYAQADAPVLTPRGPAAMVRDCEPAEALRMMLRIVADELERSQVVGTLKPLRPTIERHFANHSFPALGAVMLLPLVSREEVDGARLGGGLDPFVGGWNARPEATDRVVDVVTSWLADARGETLVRAGGGGAFSIATQSIGAFLRDAVPRSDRVTVQRVQGRQQLRQASFTPNGCVVVQTYAPDQPRPAHLAELTDLLRAVAPHVDAAFVKDFGTLVDDRKGALGRTPPLSPLGPAMLHDVWMFAHLEPHLVHDVFVIQVMTSSQLGRTPQLDDGRWTVEHLGSDRHLVSHREPGAWFDGDPVPWGDRPSPWRPVVAGHVLDAARTDFAGVLITAASIEQSPPPLPPERRRKAFAVYGLREPGGT